MASTFYVSPIGSDSQSGTLESPFASLEYAHAKAQPGDTILLRGGVYNPLSGIDLKSDGTSGKPITIASFPGEHAVLDGSRLPQGDYVINMQDASWNHLVGVEIRNGSEGGLIMQGNSHDNIIEQLDVHHNGGRSEWDGKGISLYGTGGNNLFLNNDSHDNRDLHGDNADGFQISSTGQGNVLSGNRAWGNSDDGFDLFNVQYGTQSGAVHLEGNWAFDNGFDASGNPLGDGNGFKLGGQRPDAGSGSGGHTLVHNEAWSNRGSGFDENDATAPSTLKGNTAHDNGSYNFGFWEQDNTFQGDVSYGSGRLAISGSSSGSSWDVDAVPVATDPMTDADARAARGSDGSLPGMSAVTAPETATAEPVTHGGTGDDTLKGGRGNDVLHGGAGDDIMRGGLGDDYYVVDNGFDQVIELADQGNDTIISNIHYTLSAGQSIERLQLDTRTGSANLNLTGNDLANKIIGNDGNNSLDGKGGADILQGGRGNDTYTVDDVADQVLEAADQGNDTVLSTISYKLMAGQSIERLQIASSAGSSNLNLTGNELANTIIGNDGNNVLDGGAGADLLYGRGGADTFVFSTALSAANIDRVNDFSSVDDTMQLARGVFKVMPLGVLDDAAFKVINSAPIDASDRILYNKGTGALFYDADGSGTASAAMQFATLDNKAMLTAADFLIV
ncbi:right-handed parallel beta-helix repeat-containing protein [Methylorubrum extorquens]